MKRIAFAALLLVLLGVAACGEEQPAQPAVEVPPWAKVAPEQIAEAKKYGVPVAFENDLGMRFVLIPAGTFLMGSPEDEEGRGEDEAQHKVTISDPYYMQTTEVTNRQYRAHTSNYSSGQPDLDSPAQPAAGVSWNEAAEFAAWLTNRDKSHMYSLPTEAQWEYACRAGTQSPYAFGSSMSPSQAAFHIPASSPGAQLAHDLYSMPVGTFPPNAWGVYDMHGNLLEWCSDWYSDDPPRASMRDPTGADAGDKRVLRGGAFGITAEGCRSAWRCAGFPDEKSAADGFRLVSPLPEPKGGK